MYKFFVYVYFDPRVKSSFKYSSLEFEYEPFYVGKGKGRRHLCHLNQTGRCNKVNKINSIRKAGLEPIIIKYKEELTEEDAYNLEVELIKTIGRKNLKTGPLTNYQDGGFLGSASGVKNSFYGKHHTEEHKKKQSVAIKNWRDNNPEKVELRNRKWKEVVSKDSSKFATFKNKIHKASTKELMSLSKKGKGIKESNSQFGTCWVQKENQNKKIKSNELQSYLSLGWEKGRTLKNNTPVDDRTTN